MTKATAAAYQFHDTSSESIDFHEAVITGLRAQPRRIPPKFFYDEEGSRLFESICETPEYYPTRTELELLAAHAGEVARLTGPGCFLMEPGSGNCEKVRLLLDALQPAAYMPMDISREHLQDAAHAVAHDFPWLDVRAVCTDITHSVDLPFIPPDAQRVVFYPGSSIGNFEPHEAEVFLRDLAGIARPGGGLLIGVDLKKDTAVLNAAYNDASGVTAAFNLNLLARVNRELNGDFNIDAFAHHAFYNEDIGRVEMHLISKRQQTVRIDGQRFEFEQGENIHTENSYKYTIESFQALAARAGFRECRVWTDSAKLFSLHLLRVADRSIC